MGVFSVAAFALTLVRVFWVADRRWQMIASVITLFGAYVAFATPLIFIGKISQAWIVYSHPVNYAGIVSHLGWASTLMILTDVTFLATYS